MRFIIEANTAAVGKWVANYVAKRIAEFNPSAERPFVLGLPTGSTPLPSYAEMVRLHKEGSLSFENVVTFNMDEYCGLPEVAKCIDRLPVVGDKVVHSSGKLWKVTCGFKLEADEVATVSQVDCDGDFRLENDRGQMTTGHHFRHDFLYAGNSKAHPESYRGFMWQHLFSHVNIKAENVNILDGNASDLLEECRDYERRIAAAGGIELFLGGIGPDGHIAFNESGSSLSSRTRVKTLAYDTIVANARFFGGDLELVPKRSLTVGVATVMDAREVLVIATGINKAQALHQAVEGGANHMWTASAIQTHRSAMVVSDKDATTELKVRTVKYFQDIRKMHESVYETFAPVAELAPAKRALDPLFRPEVSLAGAQAGA